MPDRKDDDYFLQGFIGDGVGKHTRSYQDGEATRAKWAFLSNRPSSGSSSVGPFGLIIIIVIVIWTLSSHPDRHPEAPKPPQDSEAAPITYRADSQAVQTQTPPLHIQIPPVPSENNGKTRSADIQAPNDALGGSQEGITDLQDPSGASSPDPYTDLTVTARHKEGWGGGCTGALHFTNRGITFRCDGQPDKVFPLNQIAGPHKDGIILKTENERKYHFEFFDKEGRKIKKDLVEKTFSEWWKNVRSR